MRYTHKHLGIWDKECNCNKWFNSHPSINRLRMIKDQIKGFILRIVTGNPYY